MKQLNQTHRLLLSAIIITSLAGCAKISKVSTNLDAENFKNYFAPIGVTIVENESSFSGKYKMIAGIEGSNCQAKAHHAAPDKIEARTEARKKAYELGANAIVFSGCVAVKTNQCHANIICYGKAYQVEQLSD